MPIELKLLSDPTAWRFVHAQRARKLKGRYRTEVRFSHWSPSGRTVYKWRVY